MGSVGAGKALLTRSTEVVHMLWINLWAFDAK
jgi:hypothetical protein